MSTEFANQLLINARADLGKAEDPPGSNWGDYVKNLLAFVHIDKPASWCAAFVSKKVDDTFKQLGLTNTSFKYSASAYRLWTLNEGLHVPKDQAPEPGDIFVFLHDPIKGTGHTGFVDSVLSINGIPTSIIDISGNSNSHGSREGYEVCSNVRMLNDPQLLGFIRLA